MSTKVRIDGQVIREARSKQKLSRQKLCDIGAEKRTPIGRASIERMETASTTQLFAYDKVKIIADLLNMNIGEIIQVEASSFENLETLVLQSGGELKEILKRADKLIVDTRIEPDDLHLQKLIIELLEDWDKEVRSKNEEKHSIDTVKDIFKKKNQLKELSENSIFVYHARSYQVAYFDVTGQEIYDEDGEQIDFLVDGVEFKALSYEMINAHERDGNYAPDFDGIGAQVVDYLILSDDEKPTIKHKTNPFGFPDGTLISISEEYEKYKNKEKK
jgi:hypothetical protein